MNKTLEYFTKGAFIGLATLPLLKPNHNSIIIILCSLLTLYYFFKNPEKQKFQFKNLVFFIPFFFFLLYELLSKSYSSKVILLNIPFLIFPLLFLYKPKFINISIRNKSLVVFQISVVTQTLLFLITFLLKNPIGKLFYVSKENIPLFREYVSNNYFFEIHPTYFSSYLLLSITISLFKFKKARMFNVLNIVFSIFFLFLFSSRIIIILLLLTSLSFIFYQFSYKVNKAKLFLIVSGLSVLSVFCFLNNSFVLKRFNEVKNEIDKPIIGNRYNSTNTRVAIYKCDVLLTKKMPFWGYGSKLQEELNNCYAENNDSDFYKISTFNTHNYYFYLLLYGGVFFILTLLFYLFIIFKKIKYSLFGIFIFFQFLIINLTENYLSRHYGIVLFCYFTSLFIFFKKEAIDTTTR